MKQIQLTNDKIALVDDEDFEFVLNFGSWCADEGRKTYYARTNRSTAMHRIIVTRVIGNFIGLVDHVDRNGLNNQRLNLRIATKSQNGANRGPQNNNTSGYKGVTWCGNRGKWQAQIVINGCRFGLGYFKNPIEAAKMYDNAARITWKQFAWTNFHN